MAQVEYEETPGMHDSRALKRGPDGKFYHETDEFQSEYSFYYSAATKASALAGTIPTGKKFHLRTANLINKEITAVAFTFKNSSATGSTIARLQVASNGTLNLSSLWGYVFETAIYIGLGTFATGTSVSMGGVLDPQEPAG